MQRCYSVFLVLLLFSSILALPLHLYHCCVSQHHKEWIRQNVRRILASRLFPVHVRVGSCGHHARTNGEHSHANTACSGDIRSANREEEAEGKLMRLTNQSSHCKTLVLQKQRTICGYGMTEHGRPPVFLSFYRFSFRANESVLLLYEATRKQSKLGKAFGSGLLCLGVRCLNKASTKTYPHTSEVIT